MAYQINISNMGLPHTSNKLKFAFNLSEMTDYTGIEEHKVGRIEDVTMGNDKDKEIIQFPSNWKLTFKITGDTEKWESILKYLSEDIVTPVTVYQGATEIFHGYVDQPTVDGDKHTNEITLTIIHYLAALKKFSPKTSTVNGPKLSIKDTVFSLLTDFVVAPLQPNITEVVDLSEIEGQIDTAGTPTITAGNFGIDVASYFNTASVYKDHLEVLKQLLLSIGCIGYAGLDRKFYIVPRNKNSSTPIQLLKKQVADNPRAKVVPAAKGMKLEVYTGIYSPRKYSIHQVGDVTDAEKTETFRTEQPGGTLPYAVDNITSAVQLWGYYGGNWIALLEDSFRRKKTDGSYTARKPLWRLIAEEIWGLINKTRLSIQIEMAGSYNQFGFGNDYTIEGLNKLFRVRKIKYNLINKRAELDLLECDVLPNAATGNVVFTKILRAIEARLIDGLAAGSPEYSGAANDVVVSGVNLRLRSKNAYGCGLLEATEYDGNVITIPADQTDVWLFNYTHVFYIYAYNIDNPAGPTTNYPIASDPNGKWYYLRGLDDQQILDADFKYEYRLAKVDMPNRFSFFVCLQPDGVPLFPGIGVLNK